MREQKEGTAGSLAYLEVVRIDHLQTRRNLALPCLAKVLEEGAHLVCLRYIVWSSVARYQRAPRQPAVHPSYGATPTHVSSIALPTET